MIEPAKRERRLERVIDWTISLGLIGGGFVLANKSEWWVGLLFLLGGLGVAGFASLSGMLYQKRTRAL